MILLIITRTSDTSVLRMVVYDRRYSGHLLGRLLDQSVTLVRLTLRFWLTIIKRHCHYACNQQQTTYNKRHRANRDNAR